MKINSNNYKNFTYFILVLIGISTLVVYAVFYFLDTNNIKIPFYLSIPSIPTLYGLLFFIFDRKLWKWKIFRKLGIISADDLNGEWKGIAKSSYDKMEEEINVTLKIKQTATNIVICGDFNNSKSISLNANFEKNDVDDGIALFYFYRNQPDYDAKETMAIHEGATKLIYNKQDNSLTGFYFSGRNRNNHGTIKVFRNKKQQL